MPANLKIGIPTVSLSKPGLHSLDHKLRSAAHGFAGIELFIDDLSHFASSSFNGSLTQAAKYISSLAKQLNLTFICLQPFGFYEGLVDTNQSTYLLTEKLPLWFAIARIIGTDLIQIPANFLQNDPVTGAARTSGDIRLIVSDLQTIADIGVKQGFRFVYEALCWSTHVDTWEAAWNVVKLVDRENFGICLDSFNTRTPLPSLGRRRMLSKPWPSPWRRSVLSSPVENWTSGKSSTSSLSMASGCRRRWTRSTPFMWRANPRRMSWSRNARLFPCEEERGGYLPVLEIARAFFEIGFEGWVSLELFSRTCNDPDVNTVGEHARRGMDRRRRVVAALGLDVEVPARNCEC
uniref:Dehydroshikimate dehydratase n=1 Tax=Emericella nidulans TaxID=162425 RepID=Q00774_EMEND|nr:dehydroshikimate dehydratase [Aspergillus nidulans]